MKSASADVIVRPVPDAQARIVGSSASRRPSSLRWVTSCPAERRWGGDRRREVRVDQEPQAELAAGQTVEQVRAEYPYLEIEDSRAAFSFAAEAKQERELPLAQPGPARRSRSRECP